MSICKQFNSSWQRTLTSAPSRRISSDCAVSGWGRGGKVRQCYLQWSLVVNNFLPSCSVADKSNQFILMVTFQKCPHLFILTHMIVPNSLPISFYWKYYIMFKNVNSNDYMFIWKIFKLLFMSILMFCSNHMLMNTFLPF